MNLKRSGELNSWESRRDGTHAAGTIEHELFVARQLSRLAVAEQDLVDGDAGVEILGHRLFEVDLGSRILLHQKSDLEVALNR